MFTIEPLTLLAFMASAQAEEGADDIYGQSSFPGISGDVLDGLGEAQAGGVYESSHGAEFGDDLIDEELVAAADRDIEVVADAADLGGDQCGALVVDVAGGDFVTVGGEAAGDGGSDALGGSRYDGGHFRSS